MAKAPAKVGSPVADGRESGQPAVDEPAGRLRGLARAKLVYVMAVAGGVALAAGSAVFFTPRQRVSPEDQLQTALRYLDDEQDQSARRVAAALQEKGYQDHDFAGGVPFILGMCAFRDAGAYDDAARDGRYVAAVSYLREAERLSIPDDRRNQWAFAAGISLYRIGLPDEAQPLLEEAFRSFVPGKHEAGVTLTQIYMDGRTSHNLEQALKLNTQMVEDATLKPADRDTAWLQRAQIFLALERTEDSEQALAKVSGENARKHGSAILRAQTMMADGKWREALTTLEPLSRDVGLERVYPAQAQYLMGVCAEQLGELENAVVFYRRTAERFERSHEALAARLGAAASLRRLGRNEEALEMYALVLRSITRPKSFRNRWITLKKLQDTVIDAWNSWMEYHYYDEAIALADMMSPAIPREQALELAARANQRWAQHLDAELAGLPFDRQGKLREEAEMQWQHSGRAHARLAENRRSRVDQFNALWISAEDFIKGRDFESAIEKLNLFITERTSILLPAALVRRGQCYTNMGQLDSALRDFQDAIQHNPTDPVAFQAQYLIGQCHLERDELDKAERAWRKMLESAELTPTAVEWRMALFSLGKLLYDTAETARRNAQPPALTGQQQNTEVQSAGLARFDDAILRLEEFRDRYPAAAEASEVRFLLARALQKSAEVPEARWKAAETDIARGEFRRQMQDRLERAIHELQALQTLLVTRRATGQLDQQGQSMLRNCFFEIANCNFLLARYEAAIFAYSTSAGQYQQEPDSLIAYVQIANCYDRLQKPAEALSTLAQAQLILKQLPDEAFSAVSSAMSREDWQRWLDWAMKLHN